MLTITINADVPVELVPLHIAYCRPGALQPKARADGGRDEFDIRSASSTHAPPADRERDLKRRY